ncbi:hypothetical protein RF55_10887 [Lasius niger]|uniref:Uncharacterized protein n=1 Tax=Lasius niger TaxID=67767 RepID=A0A0J7KGV6_LASNI|nr:hypothetical protein RF55_10887 [Lasius niger]
MEAMLEQQAQMLIKLKELVTFLQPSFAKDEKETPAQPEAEIVSTSPERLPNEPIPVTLKEDADPVEWWKS